jgi:hypothetical protein
MQVIRLLSGYRPLLEPLATREVYEVGDTVSGSVVRAGRTSAAYAEAFDALVRLAGELDVELDDENVKVEDVRTTSGPGIRLSIDRTPPGRREANDAGVSADARSRDAAASDAEHGEYHEPV